MLASIESSLDRLILLDRNRGKGAALRAGFAGATGLMAVIFTIAMALFAVYMARIRVHEKGDRHQVSGTIVPLGIERGYRRRLVELLLDLALVSVAYYGAFRLRFDTSGWTDNFVYFRQSFPVVLGIQMIALFAVGTYRGTWRYFSLIDGVMFAKGVFLGMITAQVAILYLFGFEGYSGSVFVVYGMLLFLLLGSSRASFRLMSEFILRQRQTGRRLVIYGAGHAGSIAVRHVLNDAGTAYRIVGFIDDDVAKRNVRVQGYRIIGGYDHLVGMIMRGDVDVVALTSPAPGIAGLETLCARYGVAMYRLSIDWSEIPLADAAAVPAAFPAPVERRVVSLFQNGPRQRLHAAGTASLLAGGTAELQPATNSDGATAPIRVVHIITRLILGGAQENTLYTAIGQHRDPRFDVVLSCDSLYEGDCRALLMSPEDSVDVDTTWDLEVAGFALERRARARRPAER